MHRNLVSTTVRPVNKDMRILFSFVPLVVLAALPVLRAHDSALKADEQRAAAQNDPTAVGGSAGGGSNVNSAVDVLPVVRIPISFRGASCLGSTSGPSR